LLGGDRNLETYSISFEITANNPIYLLLSFEAFRILIGDDDIPKLEGLFFPIILVFPYLEGRRFLPIAF